MLPLHIPQLRTSIFHFWAMSWITYFSAIYHCTSILILWPNKCNVVVILGLKFLVDLSDVLCTSVEYITYNMGNWDLPDIYALGLTTLRLGHLYQANPSCPCYNYYIYTMLRL